MRSPAGPKDREPPAAEAPIRPRLASPPRIPRRSSGGWKTRVWHNATRLPAGALGRLEDPPNPAKTAGRRWHGICAFRGAVLTWGRARAVGADRNERQKASSRENRHRGHDAEPAPDDDEAGRDRGDDRGAVPRGVRDGVGADETVTGNLGRI